MEPNLLVGDRLFVTKYSYGYSKHSLPFSPPIINGRLFANEPKIGDVVVFKTPTDNRTDYIKRLIGTPGDRIQFIEGDLYINNNQVLKSKLSSSDIIYCGKKIDVNTFDLDPFPYVLPPPPLYTGCIEIKLFFFSEFTFWLKTKKVK